MRVLLLLPILLAGCTPSEVGYYDLQSVTPLVATCAAGVDPTRGAAWTDAVREAGVESLRIGQEESITQAQFFRPDDSVFLSTISHQGDLLYSGSTLTENATVDGIDLGSDFSALLEAESVGCEFDLQVDVELTFRADDFAEADGKVSVELLETQVSDNRCPVVSCLIEYGFIAAEAGYGNPGLWEARE